MSGFKKERAIHRADLMGGDFLSLPHRVLDSVAYRTASLRCKAVVAAIQRSSNGFNNGKIGVTMELIAERIGNQNHAANRNALTEAEARGLIQTVKVYPRGARKASEYRLTWINTGTAKDRVDATHEYLSWQPGDPGTGKKRVSPTARRKAPRLAIIDDEGKRSTSIIARRNSADHANPPLSTSARVAITERHISSHSGGFSEAPALGVETSRGTLRGEPTKPASMTEDEWLVAGRRAARNPAGPPPEELRPRIADHIQRHGRGSQGRLARLARISEGALSKFISGKLDLTNEARVAIASIMLKAEAAELKLKPPSRETTSTDAAA